MLPKIHVWLPVRVILGQQPTRLFWINLGLRKAWWRGRAPANDNRSPAERRALLREQTDQGH